MAQCTINSARAPRRVVYVHDSHGFGGMELYLFRLIHHLDQRRYSPAILVPGYTDQFRASSPKVIEETQAAQILLLRPPHPGNIPGYSGLRDVIVTARLLRSNRTNIVHIHTCRSEGARKATIAARLAGVMGVLRTEHFPPSVTIKPISKYLVKPFDWITNYIVTGSEGDRQEQINLLKRSPTKIIRSYNSVELEKFDPAHNVREAKIQLGLDPEIPVIGSVGRLAPQKGHIYLINATAQVIEQYGAVNLLIVGDGELRSELEALAKQLGIAEHLHFVGYQEDVIPYMQATDIAAMPSLFEVFSLAMLEFMALGKPVVASSHSSFYEAISDGQNGLIVPLKDSQELANAILRLLQDEELGVRLGKAALERVRANYSFQRLADDMMDLYDRILVTKRKISRPELVSS